MALRLTGLSEPGTASTVFSIGDLFGRVVSLAFEGEYPRGGEEARFERFFHHGVQEIMAVMITGGAGNDIVYDRRNRKLLVFGAANRELEDRARYNAAITEERNIQAIVLAR